MIRPGPWLVSGLLMTIGCAESPSAKVTTLSETVETTAEAPAGGEAASANLSQKGPAALPPATLPRKIIYTAVVDLTVDHFDRVAQAIDRLVKDCGGYLADSSVTGRSGINRSGTWKVRVPVERFESFVASVVQLGELQRRQTNSQDVTEEFHDLDARIKNKKIEETRLVKHLEDSTGKLEDILAVEKELSRVREEVERMQGRLQLLANLTSLTTVTINVREWKDYVPAAAPSFGTRIGRTFQTSLRGLRQFGEQAVLVVVALVPWLPLIALLVVPFWLAFRRRDRRRRAAVDASPWLLEGGQPS